MENRNQSLTQRIYDSIRQCLSSERAVDYGIMGIGTAALNTLGSYAAGFAGVDPYYDLSTTLAYMSGVYGGLNQHLSREFHHETNSGDRHSRAVLRSYLTLTFAISSKIIWNGDFEPEHIISQMVRHAYEYSWGFIPIYIYMRFFSGRDNDGPDDGPDDDKDDPKGPPSGGLMKKIEGNGHISSNGHPKSLGDKRKKEPAFP